MRFRQLLFPVIALIVYPLLSQATPQPAAAQAGTKTVTAVHASQPGGEEGERIFQRQCSRCHNAPEGFSPRISGTIVRHMRVRASLSRHEEEELLRYFNP